MKLRTRLIIAFFGLAVVPLSSIVTYSYWTSLGAFRRAAQAEAMSDAERLREHVFGVGKLARLAGGRLTVSAAGMPPLLIHRAATGVVDELLLPGVPLGALPDQRYRERTAEVAAGDVVLFMTDGFPELRDPQGEPMGYDRAQVAFADAVAADSKPAEVLAALEAAANRWRGARPQDDDITFVVLRLRESATL